MKKLKIPYINKRYDIDETLTVKVSDYWYARLKDKKFGVINKPYAERQYYYFRLFENGKYQYLHRLVAGASDNTERFTLVDHIDRDTLNCTPQNLRLVNNSQNQINSASVNGYRGVRKVGRYYIISIKDLDGHIYSGRGFKTLEEAVSTRKKLAKLLQKEYAPV